MDVPKKILSHYLEHRKNDLKFCLEWLTKNNFCEIERVGHQLKGNGATFGYPDLTSLGAELELAAQNRDSIKTEMTLKKFSNWLLEHLN